MPYISDKPRAYVREDNILYKPRAYVLQDNIYDKPGAYIGRANFSNIFYTPNVANLGFWKIDLTIAL